MAVLTGPLGLSSAPTFGSWRAVPKPVWSAILIFREIKMVPLADDSDSGGGVVEETWLTLDGINVFDDVKLACHHKKTRIPLRLEQSTNVDNVKSSLLIQSRNKT
jgi:hypothetical protein